MRSVPSFMGEFKRRGKSSGSVNTVKQQLPIEREANVRQLKKQILQRLKKETLLTDAAESSAVDSEADLQGSLDTVSANAAFEEIKTELGKTEWDADNRLNVCAGNIALGKSPQGRRKDFRFPFVECPPSSALHYDEIKAELGKTEWDTDNLNGGVGNFALEKSPQGRRKDFRFPFVECPPSCKAGQQTEEREAATPMERRKKSTGERAKIQLHEKQDELYVPSPFVDGPPSCKAGQQTEEREAAVPMERRKKSTGERAKIQLHEKQDELYVPSFASTQAPATAERRRKTDDIKHRAAERRRVLENEKHSSSPDINIQVNDTPLIRSVRSNASTPHLARRSGSTLTVNVDDTDLKGGRRDIGTHNGFLAVSPRLVHASSFPSVYESAASTFGEDAHLKDFARKKQEKLEEDLRRVEDCLNQTFSGLKKYLKTE